MPVVDGIMDVPILEWCLAYDAVLWILLKRPPVALHHAGLVNDGGLAIGLDANGFVRNNPNYLQSWYKLYEAGSQGIVALRGTPAIGLQKIVFDQIPMILCDKWGDIEPIPPAKLKQAGIWGFSTIEKSGFLIDGMIYPTEYYPATAWAYRQIEVNSRQLIKLFHLVEGSALRVGNEVNIIEPEITQAKSSAEVVMARNVGGRPPKWDWYGVINATWAAIYAGRLKPDQRNDLNKFFKDWFDEHHGDHPENSQIAEKVKNLWLAAKIADGKAGEAAEREAQQSAAGKTQGATPRKTV